MYGGTKVKQKYELLKVYADVNNILNKIDFNELFTGFHKYKFALYNRAEIAIDGYIIPYQEEFKSNTSIFYKGEYIAIWNMELDNVEDIEILAYCLVHEMFHCYQEDNNEKRYPNDMELLNYPDDIDNYLGKYNENLYLSDAYELHDIKQLHKFFQIRDNHFKNMIYCSHFVFLNENDNVRSINGVVVLELAKDSNRDIVGYYI